jgi:RNA polymerase sigma-70 factor (ECF subfamily)
VSYGELAYASWILGKLPLEEPPVSHPRSIQPVAPSEPPKRARISFAGSEVALLQGLQNQEPGAQAAFFDTFERDVRKVLVRILGTSPDVADALQDTFLRAFKSAMQVKDALALRGWLLRVAVSVAIDHLRRRQRSRWLVFSSEPTVDVPTEGVTPELRAALRDTYRVLDKLPNEERIAFALRHIDEMELAEVADACGVSLATIKRRLARAEERFTSLAKRQPGLSDWVGAEGYR